MAAMSKTLMRFLTIDISDEEAAEYRRDTLSKRVVDEDGESLQDTEEPYKMARQEKKRKLNPQEESAGDEPSGLRKGPPSGSYEYRQILRLTKMKELPPMHLTERFRQGFQMELPDVLVKAYNRVADITPGAMPYLPTSAGPIPPLGVVIPRTIRTYKDLGPVKTPIVIKPTLVVKITVVTG